MSGGSLDASLLAELRALESARSRYQIEHPGAPLGPEDPDVRRLLEALAYSAVRTRHTMLRNQHLTWRRLLSGYFNFILQPLPAMAMAQAVVTARLNEAVVLPRGAMLRCTTLDGFVGTFQTAAELRVVPITLTGCEVVLRKQGFRLILAFASQYPRADDVGLLRLYVHYLDNYLAALRVQHNLQHHLQRCIAVYDSAVGPTTEGPECEVVFGPHFDEPYEADIQNPLERARTFFHFPEQDLQINFRVPPSPRTWTRLSLCFDLDPSWPRDPPVYRELFHPFTVPVYNLRRLFARPIEVDGTQDTYPVRYMMEDPSFSLHRAHGVYRATQDGMEPLPAAALADLQPAYDLDEQATTDGNSGYCLVVRMPEAFAKPERLLVDASWYQPEFAQHAVGPIRVTALDHNVLGLDWQTVGPVRAPLECPVRHDPERLLSLLALKMKPILEREELLELLALFGSIDTGPYRDLPARLVNLAVEVVPDGRLQGAGIRHLYHVMMKPGEPHEEPLRARFLTQLGAILDAWDYEARVELTAHSGSGPLPASAPESTRGARWR